ncbi:MAG: dihydroorotate dehydrogenase electron transfer subunit [Candidatus Saganbacteria bacterium]|nr:dihydroorotate dehydrogenase electron transfer subunit [Candidatus Saganbacteria bacterium]
MLQQRSRIINHQKLSDTYYKLTLESKEISALAKPGQFVNILINHGTCPLLRRPFAIHRKNKDKEIFEVLYEVVGNGTMALSIKKIGDELDILGPLGNGFTIDQNKKTAIIVAGGIGIAPLVALAEETKSSNQTIYFITGHGSNNAIVCIDELKSMGIETILCTDDGTAGKKGTATKLLKDLLDNKLSPISYNQSTIYSCGPKAMLKATAAIAKSKQISCQVSLEEKLACGIGACLGCSVKTKKGYKLVCKDGPVFDAEELVW